MKKHWWCLIALILFGISLHAIPEGFFTIDEITDNVQRALNHERSSYIGDLFAGDVHFDVFARQMIDQVKQTDQYMNAPEEQQKLFIEQLEANFENDRKEHTNNLINAVTLLGTRFTKMLFDNPDIDYMGMKFHSIDFRTPHEVYGVTMHEDAIIAYNNEEYMIECNFPEILEIDGGYILEQAPEFTVYRYAFPIEEIATEIARSFSEGRFNIIDSLYVNERQMQKKLDYVVEGFHQTEQYQAMTESERQEFADTIEKGRANIGVEMYSKRHKAEEAYETIVFGHNCFDFEPFSVDSCESGYITTEQGVQSMNDAKISISNKDYTVKMNISELISFGIFWKIVGTIDFTLEEK